MNSQESNMSGGDVSFEQYRSDNIEIRDEIIKNAINLLSSESRRVMRNLNEWQRKFVIFVIAYEKDFDPTPSNIKIQSDRFSAIIDTIKNAVVIGDLLVVSKILARLKNEKPYFGFTDDLKQLIINEYKKCIDDDKSELVGEFRSVFRDMIDFDLLDNREHFLSVLKKKAREELHKTLPLPLLDISEDEEDILEIDPEDVHELNEEDTRGDTMEPEEDILEIDPEDVHELNAEETGEDTMEIDRSTILNSVPTSSELSAEMSSLEFSDEIASGVSDSDKSEGFEELSSPDFDESAVRVRNLTGPVRSEELDDFIEDVDDNSDIKNSRRHSNRVKTPTGPFLPKTDDEDLIETDFDETKEIDEREVSGLIALTKQDLLSQQVLSSTSDSSIENSDELGLIDMGEIDKKHIIHGSLATFIILLDKLNNDTFVASLNNNVDMRSAFDLWIESKGELDVALSRYSEDIIRAFFRLCIENEMLDDAKRLLVKTRDRIDYRHQIASIYLKMDFAGGQEEMMKRFESKFCDIVDFDSFRINKRIVASLEQTNGKLYQYVLLKSHNTEMINELELIKEKMQQVVVRRDKLEKLLEKEKQAGAAVNFKSLFLKKSVDSERQRVMDRDQTISDLRGQLAEGRIRNNVQKEELVKLRTTTEKEIDRLNELLRKVNQEVIDYKTSVLADGLENASLRERMAISEQAELDLTAKQAELDEALHSVEEFKSRLAASKLENEKQRLDTEDILAVKENELSALRNQIQGLRDDNDKFHSSLIDLENKNAVLNSEVIRLSSIERKFEDANQRISHLESYLTKERGMNGGLKDLSGDGVKNQAQDDAEETARKAKVDAEAETLMLEVLKLINDGKMRKARKFGKKISTETIGVHSTVIKQKFYGLINMGRLKNALVLFKLFANSCDFSAEIKRAYFQCKKDGRVDYAELIKKKLGKGGQEFFSLNK